MPSPPPLCCRCRRSARPTPRARRHPPVRARAQAWAQPRPPLARRPLACCGDDKRATAGARECLRRQTAPWARCGVVATCWFEHATAAPLGATLALGRLCGSRRLATREHAATLARCRVDPRLRRRRRRHHRLGWRMRRLLGLGWRLWGREVGAVVGKAIILLARCMRVAVARLGHARLAAVEVIALRPVSYTHLTLPTICSV
eukprot:2531876-Prymnesium_polylepis.2